jgi:transposase
VAGVRTTLERLLAEGQHDALVELVLGMLTQALEHNAELAWRLEAAKKLLGKKKSERISKEQLALFLAQLTGDAAALAKAVEDALAPDAAAEATDASAPPAPDKPIKPKQPHKKPFPDDLRREIKKLDVPADQRTCDACGGPKSPMGYDVQEIWEFKPAEFFVIEERLQKVVCRTCEAGVVTADGTPKPIERGRPGPGLLAQIVTAKLDDSSPLYRQTGIYERSGIRLAPSTIGDWFAAAASIVAPLATLAQQLTLGTSYLVSLDDTGMPVLDRDTPNGIKKGHIWTFIGDQDRIAFCTYTPTWEGDAACTALADFKGSVVQGDAYAGINAVFKGRSPPKRAGCMDHARRRFVTAVEGGDARAAIVLSLMGKAYAVEAEARADGADLDELLRRRRERTRPIMLQLQRAVADLHAVAEPKSPLGKATTYVINQWPTLNVFLDDARVPISNAHVERGQRRTAMGRRNYLFAGSDEGAARLAVLTTLVTNCRLHGVSVFDYFRDVLAKLAGNWPNSRLAELLPGEWKRARAAADQAAQQPQAQQPVAAA